MANKEEEEEFIQWLKDNKLYEIKLTEEEIRSLKDCFVRIKSCERVLDSLGNTPIYHTYSRIDKDAIKHMELLQRANEIFAHYKQILNEKYNQTQSHSK